MWKSQILATKAYNPDLGYSAIAKIVGCDKSTVQFHLSPTRRDAKQKATLVRNRAKKLRLIESHGGACSKCGYNKCAAALEFHHKDSEEKEFHVTRSNITFEKALVESRKCLLVCANCHREIHDDLK